MLSHTGMNMMNSAMSFTLQPIDIVGWRVLRKASPLVRFFCISMYVNNSKGKVTQNCNCSN